MDTTTINKAITEQLDSHEDETLREIITRARQILASRDDQRKKEALASIRQIARQHGLDVAVKKPARKRGRPPKKAAAE